MPAAFLARAGHDPVVQDLAYEPLDEQLIRAADFVAISVPMHTALRLGAVAGARVRELNERCHLCFFGLYAPLNADYLRSLGADSVLGGECEPQLVALVERQQATGPIALERLDFPVPRRQGLPVLDRYAKLADGEREHNAGYTEASRGCRHMCRHCPIPPIYRGRFFVVDVDTVIADVSAQVEAGAEHITFGDPDFFNGPGHGMRVLREAHARWPELTFDDTILAKLDKGHTRADIERVLALAREAGLVLRPTFVPFTPWTSLDDMVELADHIEREDLIDCVDPVQLSVRLLVPPGSLLLESEPPGTFGKLDPAALTHSWVHTDPRVDALQREIAARVEAGGDFAAVRAAIYQAAGRPTPPLRAPQPNRPTAPRLTEHWFC
jgi:radical SAM superfamily enzyme YgiQ (UPF0313 family)